MNEDVDKVSNTPENKPKSFILGGIILIALVLGAFLFLNNKELRPITMDEISTHNSQGSCWTTINGNVYDVTRFISKHKGGDKILAVCGIDGTDLFTGKSPMGRVHSDVAIKLLSSMKIGTLQQ